MSPNGAILLQSPGRESWVKSLEHIYWAPIRGGTSWDHCIIRHSLRYYRHSGSVIYKSKLPAPSVSMPCDYRILQSPTKGQVKLVLWETAQRSLPARVLGVVVALYCICPLEHLRACVSAAPTELFILLFDIYPGFHIGLRPHFTLGYAGVPPLQGYSTTTPKSMQYVVLILHCFY